MTWTDTLQKNGNGGMSSHAIGLIEYVLTEEPQSVREILDAMFEKSKEYQNRNEPEYQNRNTSNNSSRIPTTNELKYWLSRQPNVESARFQNWTNKVVPRTSNVRDTSIKYWRESGW